MEVAKVAEHKVIEKADSEEEKKKRKLLIIKIKSTCSPDWPDFPG